MLKAFHIIGLLGVGLCLLTLPVRAEGPLPLYTDHLVNGFQNWSWAANNFSDTYGGSNCISASAADWEALWLEHSGFNTVYYTNLSFRINGGAGGGQVVQVIGTLGGNSATAYVLPALAPNAWVEYTMTLSSLGVAETTNCTGFWIQLTASGTTNTFYITDVNVTAGPAPSIVHIGVNATNAIRTVDARWFGVNTADWDGDLDTAETVSELQEAGFQFLRFPGGSESDDYHWASNTTDSNTWMWATSFDGFAHVATNIGAKVVITANYGTGSPAEAAAWVKYSNVTNKYGFEYWEVGNEEYGSWETDSNSNPHDPFTYAQRAQSYIQQMKAADAGVKIGVVVITGEDTDSNGYSSHPATNSATGQVHYGWTPVLLSTLKSLGATPDFVIYHWYPEYTGQESDPLLLQGTSNWIGAAANIRGMITDYFGSGGTNIELLVTENNSNSGASGQQSVSLVNALYYADSVCQLMTTEFNSLVWWDLRNGVDTTGTIDPTLYGWRLYGDMGLLDGLGASLTNRYPPYFTAKLMQYFARPGDTVLNASSDWGLVSAYAVRRTNGSLTLMVINKDSTTSLTGKFALTNFVPSAAATLYSYGMPQDDAAKMGLASCDVAQTNFSGAADNFSFAFAPYSATVFALAPAAAAVTVLPGQTGGGEFVMQVSGQPEVPYVVQVSTNLATWTSVSTNVSTSGLINATNTMASTAAFWRAVWIP
ncbi:MAG TPA: hypothetical protein VMR33_11950 [Candidatus Baltobacteraceae bacterium]|jgi:hypothetical protein|nr:hypothetical protein [Candidatus Baltobacteraceae bacterium]